MLGINAEGKFLESIADARPANRRPKGPRSLPGYSTAAGRNKPPASHADKVNFRSQIRRLLPSDFARRQFVNFAGLKIQDCFLLGRQAFAGNGSGPAFRYFVKNQCYSLLRLGRRNRQLPCDFSTALVALAAHEASRNCASYSMNSIRIGL
jgi:hypothetical protein